MRKILLYIAFIILGIITFNNTYAIKCDQIFEGTILRYNANYKFYDIWHAGSKDSYMNYYSVDFINPEYLDKGSNFDWTNTLKNNGYKVPANSSMRILETGPTNRRIAKHPNTRTNATRNSYDFMIAYTITYDHSNNYPDSSDDKKHTECKYYSVSWCGDGIVDSGDEVCDPNDPNHTNWGNGGCNTFCQPININPPATCDGITANPNDGLAPLSSTITCNATNANTYQIKCGNGEIINGKTGVCEYSLGGKYEASCVINGNITSNACKTIIDVKAPTPLIEVEKYSGNSNDLDGDKSHTPLDDSQTINSGDKAVFYIQVRNNGNEDLKNVSLNDPLTSNCNKSISEVNDILKTIGNHDTILNVGESFVYSCENLNPETLEKVGDHYENRINVYGTGVNSNKNVSDTDETRVVIITGNEPVCTGLNVDPNSGVVPLNSNFLCTGTDTNNQYRIDIKDSNGNIIHYINTNSGIYTFSSTGTYVVTCYVGGRTTTESACVKTINVSDNNQQSVCGNGIVETGEQCDDGNTISGDGCSSICQVEGGDGGNVGGGGIGPICYDADQNGNNVTCIGNHKVKSFKVDCGNGTYKFVSATDGDNNQKTGTVTCDYTSDSDGDGNPDHPKTGDSRCYVSGLSLDQIPDPNTYDGWTTRNQCIATTNPICGNGILEGNEECEKDSSGNWPSICNTNCTLKTPNVGGGGVTTIPGETPGVITIPNHGNIIFGQRANVIIYKGQSVAEKVGTPYIKNDSDYDLNLKAICVVQTSGNTLTIPAIQPNCKTLPNILYPGQRVEFPGAYNEYIGKEVPDGLNYGDNELKITYQNHAGEIFDWAYFAESVKVRVAKPSIITTGGGASFIRNTNKVSDINRIAIGVIDSTKIDDNKNFVGTSVSSLKSLSENTTNSTIIDKVESTGSGYQNSIDNITSSVISTPSTTIVDLNDRELYNGMKNIFIFKNKSLRINDENILNSSFNNPVTIIIENGNLYIDKNIIYNDNIAFVVKGGDIIIKNNVTRMDGTYITIKKGTNGGKFISQGESSEVLVINGSIYGNIDDLVSKRVNVENNDGNLSVGTIVSFGSALFKKPAPLVSQFIEEYLNQQKIAQ